MKKFIFSLFLAIGMVACSADDDQQQQENQITGDWTLTSFGPGFAPTENYENGEIIWKILPDNQIEVTLNTTPSNNLPLNESGIYPFEIVSENRILLEDIEYDFQVETQTLRIMNNPSADGPLLVFQKME